MKAAIMELFDRLNRKDKRVVARWMLDEMNDHQQKQVYQLLALLYSREIA